jgi:hypothetical protein
MTASLRFERPRSHPVAETTMAAVTGDDVTSEDAAVEDRTVETATIELGARFFRPRP